MDTLNLITKTQLAPLPFTPLGQDSRIVDTTGSNGFVLFYSQRNSSGWQRLTSPTLTFENAYFNLCEISRTGRDRSEADIKYYAYNFK